MVEMVEKTSLSIIIPVYNEAAILAENLGRLFSYLDHLPLLSAYEVVVVDDGSTDRTAQILDPLATSYQLLATIHSSPSRHIGRAKRLGWERARYDFVMNYAIDLPFGLEIIEHSLKEARIYPHSLIIGSKGHPQSEVKVPSHRRLQSRIFNGLLNSLYHLGVKDSQGTALCPKEALDRALPHLTADTDFVQAQLLIWGKRLGYQLREIPVSYRQPRKKSHFTPRFHAWPMFWELIREVFATQR